MHRYLYYNLSLSTYIKKYFCQLFLTYNRSVNFCLQYSVRISEFHPFVTKFRSFQVNVCQLAITISRFPHFILQPRILQFSHHIAGNKFCFYNLSESTERRPMNISGATATQKFRRFLPFSFVR